MTDPKKVDPKQPTAPVKQPTRIKKEGELDEDDLAQVTGGAGSGGGAGAPVQDKWDIASGKLA